MTNKPEILGAFDPSVVPDREQLLKLYESWFERYPSYAKQSLRRRLPGDSAWFELMMHELLIQIGCKVEVKDIGNAGKNPDFLVQSDGGRCYTEVTTVNPESNIAVVDPNFEDALRKLRKLSTTSDTLKSSGLEILLHVEGRITRTLGSGELKQLLEKLLTENDLLSVKEYPWTAQPQEITGEGWKLRAELEPRLPSMRQENEELVTGPYGSFSGDASNKVREAVKKKARKYPNLDAPLIVALNVWDPRFRHETAEMAALFGDEAIQYFLDRPDIPDRTVRMPDGVWVKGGYEPR